MIKKILFTALVIAVVYLVVRWRQQKTAAMLENQRQETPQRVWMYYLAGSVLTLMIIGMLYWSVIP